MSDKKSIAGKVAAGSLIAAAAGYVAGVLTAPKSGKETREDIKNKANETYAATEKKLKELHTDLNDVLSQANTKLAELRERGGKKFTDALSHATEAKEKARMALSGLHDGDVQDKDLKAAINEATKAVENLRNYLKK